jgi:hypothetical protein
MRDSSAVSEFEGEFHRAVSALVDQSTGKKVALAEYQMNPRK